MAFEIHPWKLIQIRTGYWIPSVLPKAYNFRRQRLYGYARQFRGRFLRRHAYRHLYRRRMVSR